mmetsp:Transcript_60533/g.136826  ORF Transcript_60533/g.136826 Transcript_60533/m.136826 type:complete len:514 (-) Transcript_60533:111-1652(-)|eukprot:CAMPEP_0172609004 /NCGR_PEP_ID=MMETSP1068-20121228/29037_1 /TAXON_ID=35684 /ORGANISM="Pseudopedinella elastica, Strain CCMP716" /LENGTH=513 /DNA_ID=CAMNT_0013412423 /DNA_START=54 /DNA_END=1595 /DNA_ORIENTATION=+
MNAPTTTHQQRDWLGIGLKIFACLVVACFIFSTACCFYALVYYFVIPRPLHETSIFFDYQSNGPPYDLPKKSVFPESLSRAPSDHWGPTSIVDLLARHGQWQDFSRVSSQGATSAAEACSDLLLTTGPRLAARAGKGFSSAGGGEAGGSIASGALVDSAASPKPSAAAPRRRLLTSGVGYSITLDLVVPASEANLGLGVFMVRADLHCDPDGASSMLQKQALADEARDRARERRRAEEMKAARESSGTSCPRPPYRSDEDYNDEFGAGGRAGGLGADYGDDSQQKLFAPCIVLASSRRPAVVPRLDAKLGFFQALAWAPLAFMGPFLWLWNWGPPPEWHGLAGGAHSAASVQRMRLEMFDHFYESSTQSLSAVTITLSTRDLEVYSARLLIEPKLHGIRFVMQHWFWTTAIFVIGFLVSFQTTFLCALYAYCIGFGGARERRSGPDTPGSSRGSEVGPTPPPRPLVDLPLDRIQEEPGEEVGEDQVETPEDDRFRGGQRGRSTVGNYEEEAGA